MADAPNDTNFVDPNTDDLDAFNDLMTGRAKVKEDPAPEDKEPVQTDDSTDVDTSETQDEDENLETDTDDLDEDESGEDEESTDEPVKPVKKVNRFQERINELTAKAREAERKLDELMRKQSEPAKEDKPTPVQPVQKNDGPTPDDTNEDGSEKYPLGEFDPQYIRDLTRHTIQAEQAAASERQERERVEREATQAREQLQNQWVEKVSTAAQKHSDFMEKTITLESTFDGLDAGYSDYLVQTIKSLDHGPEVLYHLANHLDEAEQFVKLGPLGATLALGEMNARFKTSNATQQAKPEPAKVSSAPTPPPVNKGSKTRTTVAADTDDLDAFSQAFFAPKRRR